MDEPETRYAKLGEGYVAYQVVGDGPLDVVLEPALLGSHLELAWEVAAMARVFRRLASFSRLVRLDHRGRGLSDPLGLTEQTSLEVRAMELVAVLDAVGCERAAVVANGFGGLVALFFAGAYPNRISALVLDGCFARFGWAPDYPWGAPLEVVDRGIATLTGTVGPTAAAAAEEGFEATAAHARREDPEFAAQYLRYLRATVSPALAAATVEMVMLGDVRPVLSAIQVPTLVMYRTGDEFGGKPHAEYLSEHIASARLLELRGADNLIFAGDSDADVDEIEGFLTGVRPVPHTDRILATVLFTDIVASTQQAAELGDRRWRQLLDSHDRTVRRQLQRFGGHEVNTVGDGFVATFDGPGRAIQCACAIRGALGALGIEVRAGLHTGEIEVRGTDVAGLAVHIGARVAHLAAGGEVLVSSTVKDLVAGSGIEFEDRGEYELKGVPGAWNLYSVVT